VDIRGMSSINRSNSTLPEAPLASRRPSTVEEWTELLHGDLGDRFRIDEVETQLRFSALQNPDDIDTCLLRSGQIYLIIGAWGF
jgi:hypothetical protein